MLIIGERYRDKLQTALQDASQEVIWMPDDPDSDPRLADHADLSVFCPDKQHVFLTAGVYDPLVNSLTNGSRQVIRYCGKGSIYPTDAGLCVCVTGRYTIYNPKTCAADVIPYLTGKLIPVTQGYTKCSVCTVTDDAIITQDDLIASRAAEAGMDVLKISPGHIALEGFAYGFIGGAAFLISSSTMAFTGLLDAHPDKSRILAFLEKHGLKPLYLTREPIFDIGGAAAIP